MSCSDDLMSNNTDFSSLVHLTGAVGRYLLCPGHLSVPATGRRLAQRVPDGAADEDAEGL